MKKTKIFLNISILFLSIGFAAVATNLFINGNILVGTNKSDFDVIFTKSIIDSVDLSDTTINEDGKTLTFNTKDLFALGDKSTLDFEVTNKSTQYDANVTIECVGGSNASEYYTITKKFPSLVIAGTKEVGKVEVELKKVTTSAITENFACTLNVNAIERNETAKIQNSCKSTSGSGENVGDKITCGSESFYVIKNDGINIRMLAEYNLELGGEYYYEWKPLENTSGLQNSEMLGWNYTGIYKGVVPFDDNSSEYSGSLIEGYVNDYKIKLKKMGANVLEATLITKEELNELGIRDNTMNSLPGREWIYQATYWTRTVSPSNYLWRLATDGEFNASSNGIYSNNTRYGVRPVIVIPANDI